MGGFDAAEARQYPPRPPMELSALRVAGLVVSVAVVAFAVWRRRSLRNVDVLILLFAGLALAIVSATEITNALLEFFSFRKGGGGRILGLAVFAIFVLFVLLLRNMALTGGSTASCRRCSRASRGRSSASPACRSGSATRWRS